MEDMINAEDFSMRVLPGELHAVALADWHLAGTAG